MVQSSTIVIGDVHGCLEELQELLKLCDYRQSKDRLLFLGDLIDRGPDTRGVLELAMKAQKKQDCVSSIMGNHELQAIKQLNLFGEVTFSHRIGCKQSEVKDISLWLACLPYYERLSSRAKKIACVHGGVWPGVPLEQQHPDRLARLQMMNSQVGEKAYLSDLSSSQRDDPNWKFWANSYEGEELVVFGHSCVRRVTMTEKTCALDGGCVFGGELRALILPEMQIITVKSHTKIPSESEKRNWFYPSLSGLRYYPEP